MRELTTVEKQLLLRVSQRSSDSRDGNAAARKYTQAAEQAPTYEQVRRYRPSRNNGRLNVPSKPPPSLLLLIRLFQVTTTCCDQPPSTAAKSRAPRIRRYGVGACPVPRPSRV